MAAVPGAGAGAGAGAELTLVPASGSGSADAPIPYGVSVTRGANKRIEETLRLIIDTDPPGDHNLSLISPSQLELIIRTPKTNWLGKPQEPTTVMLAYFLLPTNNRSVVDHHLHAVARKMGRDVATSFETHATLLQALFNRCYEYSCTHLDGKDLAGNHRALLLAYVLGKAVLTLHLRIPGEVQVKNFKAIQRVLQEFGRKTHLVEPTKGVASATGRRIKGESAVAIRSHFGILLGTLSGCLGDLISAVEPSAIQRRADAYTLCTNLQVTLLNKLTQTLFRLHYFFLPIAFEVNFAKMAQDLFFGSDEVSVDGKLKTMLDCSAAQQFLPCVFGQLEIEKIWRELLRTHSMNRDEAFGRLKKHDWYTSACDALKTLEQISYGTVLRQLRDYKRLKAIATSSLSAEQNSKLQSLHLKLRKTAGGVGGDFSLGNSKLFRKFPNGASPFNFVKDAGTSDIQGRKACLDLMNLLGAARNVLVMHIESALNLNSAYACLSPALVMSLTSVTEKVSADKTQQCLRLIAGTVYKLNAVLQALSTNSLISLEIPAYADTFAEFCNTLTLSELPELQRLVGECSTSLYAFQASQNAADIASAIDAGLGHLDDFKRVVDIVNEAPLPDHPDGYLRDLSDRLRLQGEKEQEERARLASLSAAAIQDSAAGASGEDSVSTAIEGWRRQTDTFLLGQGPIDAAGARDVLMFASYALRRCGVPLHDKDEPVSQNFVSLAGGIRELCSVHGTLPASRKRVTMGPDGAVRFIEGPAPAEDGDGRPDSPPAPHRHLASSGSSVSSGSGGGSAGLDAAPSGAYSRPGAGGVLGLPPASGAHAFRPDPRLGGGAYGGTPGRGAGGPGFGSTG